MPETRDPGQGPTPHDDPTCAAHGYRNEVSWRGGQGRQPYANQEPAPAGGDSSGAFHEVEGGDRGVHSGTTLEHMRQARGTPEVPPTRQSQP